MDEQEPAELMSDQEIINYIFKKLDKDEIFFGDAKQEYEQVITAYVEAYKSATTDEERAKAKELKKKFFEITDRERDSDRLSEDRTFFKWQALRELVLAEIASELGQWEEYMIYLGGAYDCLWSADHESDDLVFSLMKKKLKEMGIEEDAKEYLTEEGIIHQ